MITALLRWRIRHPRETLVGSLSGKEGAEKPLCAGGFQPQALKRGRIFTTNGASELAPFAILQMCSSFGGMVTPTDKRADLRDRLASRLSTCNLIKASLGPGLS
jgi:hypothetical protein